jgi:shikimate dehydrogenase
MKIIEVHSAGGGLMGRFLKKLATQEKWEFEHEVVPEFSTELFKSADAMIVEMKQSPQILENIAVLPSLVRQLHCADSFFQEDGGKWLPRLLCFEALFQVIVDRAKNLSIRAPAFVIGQGEVARMAASVLTKLGFSEIYLVAEAKESLEEHLQILQRGHLGISFKPLLVEELTMQSVSASIVVNTEDLSENKMLLDDLAYFNYMAGEGLVVDLHLSGDQVGALLEEAHKAELRAISSEQMMAQYTVAWLQHLKISHSLTSEQLVEAWTLFFRENSSSV